LGAALYQPPRPAQLTVDVDAASIGFTYAPRVSERVLVGGGGGFGLSPFLTACADAGEAQVAAIGEPLLALLSSVGL